MTLSVTSHSVFRDFWYPVAREYAIGNAPIAVKLLGVDLAIWRVDVDTYGAVIDKCAHRDTKLSCGKVTNRTLACPYHGWQYTELGICTTVPQQPLRKRVGGIKVDSFMCKAKYGYVWVCLGTPQVDIPLIPESTNQQFYQIHEFLETWNCSGLRIIENGFDNAHFSFVHGKTFGVDNRIPDPIKLIDTLDGFILHTVVPVKNPDAQKENLKITGNETVRTITHEWYMPFGRRMEIKYPNGIIHTILNWATPIDDNHTLFFQFAYRGGENNRQDEHSISKVVAWDRAVTLEDKKILESVYKNVCFDLDAKVHMPSDMPGIIMRKKLKKLIRE